MSKRNNCLISGTSTGLGNYLLKKFKSEKFERNKKINHYINNKYNTIIHCAFNKKIMQEDDKLTNLIYDNILLIQNLINIPHEKFILISTVDVYEKNNTTHKETETNLLKSETSFYSAAKILQE